MVEVASAIRLSDRPDARPWWATFIVNVGVPAAIAMFVVWWLTHSLEHRVSNLEQVSGQTLSMMLDAGKSMHEFVLRSDQREILHDQVLRQICINTATPQTVALCSR